MNLFLPDHVKLVNACYPASPLAAAPQFKPNSQELSRLTYFGSNRPGKLNKLGEELEKRAKQQARKAQSNNAKYRALLLITLEIIKSLVTECRRDLTLFTSNVLESVHVALSCLPKDLEVVARAASAFTAWATYTDGTLLGVDSVVTRTYLEVLSIFSTMGVNDPPKGSDDEFRSRKRIVGLAVLNSAIQSDALFNSMSIFSKQVTIVVTTLLRVITSADLGVLATEATAVDTYAGSGAQSPYMAEFQPQRPVAQRRAPSIHVHVDGERGPSFQDVVGAALRAFQTLVARSNAVQIPLVLEALFSTFDSFKGHAWEDLELCRWMVSKVTDWTQYQYRYAIPSRLLERLMEVKDVQELNSLHFALVVMISTVFTSPTPLVNLSTSDILSNLLSIMMARLAVSPNDDLLPSLIDCVSSLGTHIYYADQLQDLAEEIINRLVNVQVHGLQGRYGDEKGREAGMRCLIACLVGILRVADEAHPARGIARRPTEQTIKPGDVDTSAFTGETIEVSSPIKETANGDARIMSPDLQQRLRRNKVAPEVWQDTLPLLCEAEYAVRSDYACALVRFLREEVEKEIPGPPTSDHDSPEALTRIRKSMHDQPDLLSPSDPTIRFLNALHATTYTLALAAHLGLTSGAPSSSSPNSSFAGLNPPAPINVIPPTPMATPEVEKPLAVAAPEESTEHSIEHLPKVEATLPRRSTPSGVRPRQSSVTLSLLASTVSGSPATLSDYSHVLKVLETVHESLPVRSVLTGVPMLFALDAAVGNAGSGNSSEDSKSLYKRKAIREMIWKLWIRIAEIWGCTIIREAAMEMEGLFGPNSTLPSVSFEDLFQKQPSKRPKSFVSAEYEPTDPMVFEATYIMDPQIVIPALSENANLQKATGLDKFALRAALSIPWTPERAVKESMEIGISPDQLSRSDGGAHFLKISPALMQIDNQSLASLARTARGVGVDDLREALEGRASMSNPNLASTVHSMSTDADHRSHRTGRDAKLGKLALAQAAKQRKTAKSSPADVADVLNKLGIGKQTPSRNLRAPLQGTLKQNGSTSNVLVPPYTA